MTLLCISVQNSQTMLGIFSGDVLTAHWRVSTDARRTADEWGLLLDGLVRRDADPALVDGICVSSTVPAVLHQLRVMLSERAVARSVIVGPGVRSGLPVLTDNPREVGTDRIANAIGALDLCGAPVIVVDFGSATTFDVINTSSEYVGGAIAPGVQISLEALGMQSAQLRQVELAKPRSAIAKNTVEAIQSGAVFGFAGQVDGIIERMRSELALDPAAATLQVVATGSLAEPVIGQCASITRYEPWLTLDGLRIIFGRNAA